MQYTPEEVVEFARGSNFGAPLTLRVNPLKTTRDDLIRSLKQNYNFQVKATERSPLGITFVVKPMEALQLKPEFKVRLGEALRKQTHAHARRTHARARIHSAPAYRAIGFEVSPHVAQDGLFEIQDEASQIAALMVDPKPDQQVCVSPSYFSYRLDLI